MRGIEVKYRVDDLEALLAALKAHGIELSHPVYQDDQAYAPVTWQVRRNQARHLLPPAAHRRRPPLLHPQAAPQQRPGLRRARDRSRRRQAMRHAAPHMGYRPTVRIAKTRRTATIGDTCPCVDDLEGVDGFIEVERLVPDADVHAIQAISESPAGSYAS